jgi:hypothetical protein
VSYSLLIGGLIALGPLLGVIALLLHLREEARKRLMKLASEGALNLPASEKSRHWIRLSTLIKDHFGIVRRNDDFFPPTPKMTAGVLNDWLTKTLNDRREFMKLPLYTDLQNARLAVAETVSHDPSTLALHASLDLLFPRHKRLSLWKSLRQKCPHLLCVPEFQKWELTTMGCIGVALTYAIMIPTARWFDRNYPVDVSEETKFILHPLGLLIFAAIFFALLAILFFPLRRFLFHAPPECRIISQIAIVSASNAPRADGKWTLQETWLVLRPLIARAFPLAEGGIEETTPLAPDR